MSKMQQKREHQMMRHESKLQGTLICTQHQPRAMCLGSHAQINSVNRSETSSLHLFPCAGAEFSSWHNFLFFGPCLWFLRRSEKIWEDLRSGFEEFQGFEDGPRHENMRQVKHGMETPLVSGVQKLLPVKGACSRAWCFDSGMSKAQASELVCPVYPLNPCQLKHGGGAYNILQPQK